MWLSYPVARRRPRFKLRSKTLSKTRRRSRSRSRSHSRSCSRSRSRVRSLSRSKRLQAKYKDIKWSLVPRHSSEMNICWKYSILLIMVIVTAVHMLTTYSFKSILLSHTYGNVCFLSTKVSRPDTVCDYLLLSPICMAIVSMIWTQMFYICGRGGYTFRMQHFDEQPWRIVLPAVVCFALVSIFQFVYVSVLHVHMTFYCNELRKESREHQEKSCEYLVGTTSKTPVAGHYRMLYYSAMVAFLLWIGATTIMVVRVFRTPDFKIVIDKRPKEKLTFKDCELMASRPSHGGNKEKLIFMNTDSPFSRSVHFKRMSM